MLSKHESLNLWFLHILAEAVAGTSKDSTNGSVSNMQTGKNKELPSFWIPALTPQAKATLIEKPVSKLKKFAGVVSNPTASC